MESAGINHALYKLWAKPSTKLNYYNIAMHTIVNTHTHIKLFIEAISIEWKAKEIHGLIAGEVKVKEF